MQYTNGKKIKEYYTNQRGGGGIANINKTLTKYKKLVNREITLPYLLRVKNNCSSEDNSIKALQKIL